MKIHDPRLRATMIALCLTVPIGGWGGCGDDASDASDGGPPATGDEAVDDADGGSAPDFGAACLTADPGASVECAQCMCDVCPEEVSACDDACWTAVECARPCTLLANFSEEIACIMAMCPDHLAAYLTEPIASFDRCMIAGANEGDLRACQRECDEN